MDKIMLTINKIVNYIKYEVHNPYSAMTNLSYIGLGWLRFYTNPVLGFLMIGLGVASTGFHMTRTNHWHKADIVAIYYVFAVIGTWLLVGNTGLVLGVAIGGIAHWSFKDYSRFSQEIIGVLGLYCFIPYWMVHGWGPVGVVLLWFGLSFATSFIADRLDPDEDGKVYDAFHSIWHIFSGIGIYYLTKPIE